MDVYVAECWAMEVAAFKAPILPMNYTTITRRAPLQEIIIVPYRHMQQRSPSLKYGATAPHIPLLRKDFLMETP